jgi:hypothetical protein
MGPSRGPRKTKWMLSRMKFVVEEDAGFMNDNFLKICQ